MNLQLTLPVPAPLLLCAAFATASAQTPAAAPASTPRSNEEVVTLTEFSVSAEPDRGYVASETLTGTRVRTPIIDLPYTINVLTSEFFEDFAIFELADNLVHIGSFTQLDIGGGFQLRGFGSTSQLRDGFYRLGRYGSSNVDRTEIIKGSNAAIYGRTSPGGMINMISKQPKDREYYRLMLNYGDYDTRRGVFEATGPIFRSGSNRTSYVLTLSQYERQFDMEYARNRNHEYYLAVKHTFADRSSLMLQAEYFLQERDAPTSAAPLITDQKGTASNLDDETIGYAKNLAGYNAFGPHSELNRGNTGFTNTYEKKLNDIWSVRGAGNYYKARRWDYNQNTGFGAITINPPNGAAPTSTRGTTPNKGLIFEDGGGVQADALAHYWLRNRTIENRTLVTLDFNDYYRWDPTWNFGPANDPALVAWAAANSGRVITLTRDYHPTAPITYFPKFFQWGGEQISRLTKRRTTVLGGLLRHQSAFMQSRLLTYVGARFDAVRFQQRDWTTAVAQFRVFPGYTNYNQGDMIRRRVDQLKPNFGANYKLTPNFRVFGNYSESYFVNQTDNPIVFADPSYKPEIANGWDYGFKGSFLNDRLTFTLGGFYAIRENVSVSNTFEDPPGSGNFVTQNQRDGNQLVRGYEADFNWRATDELTFTGSYGNVYSIYTDFGSANPLAVGRRVQNVSPYNGSISGKYAPRGGLLRGWSFNAQVTHVAATPTETPNAGDTYRAGLVGGQRVLERTTYQWRLEVPAVTLVNAGVHYAFPRRGGFDHRISINVNNITDEDYLRVNRQLGERRAFYFTYTLGYGPGR